MEQIMIILCLSLALVSVGTGIGIVLYQRRKMGRLLDVLNDMVQASIEGTFKEKAYDETKLSALESRLHRFLVKAAHQEERHEKERDKIKMLISDIAHQTKTPIANMVLYGELLGETVTDPGQKQLVEQMNLSSKKLEFLIKSLMKTSRIENGMITLNPQKQPVKELLGTICREAAPAAEKKGLEVSVKGDEVEAYFDYKWTKEALFNIVDNAVKYTPEGGKVSILIREYEQFCRVDIQDTGRGIAEEDIGYVFNRFYRSAKVSAVEGVGIGLFLAREIVCRQNGYIRLDSKEGEGSTFSVFLSKNEILSKL